MNTKLKKIARTAAVGIFFIALFLNVKLSLTDPFINIDNAAIAQTSSLNIQCYSILEGFDGQSVACSPCYLATGIPPWYHFGSQCTPNY
ncbi:hypothetical protein [Algoriphagus antarcticus]|uniref:Uncharacterized protein n=1 Tax=Algoriphagus antarcticus TaxID=238540 RepID=A0A3E0DA97_9BACT|nr:hypothetical protein [Algoriphagus antarcticus]REG78468.1 hypothetical protein C8N25_1331 [Algoriphagus antarcticus]